jgi:hypothetical protein
MSWGGIAAAALILVGVQAMRLGKKPLYEKGEYKRWVEDAAGRAGVKSKKSL